MLFEQIMPEMKWQSEMGSLSMQEDICGEVKRASYSLRDGHSPGASVSFCKRQWGIVVRDLNDTTIKGLPAPLSSAVTGDQ